MLASPANGAEVKLLVPGHPRLYFTAGELDRLRGLRDQGVHARIWRNMAASADWCLTRLLRTEWIAPVAPDPIYLNLYDRFYAMMHDMAIMEHLASAYAYSGDERYGQAAKDWALACCHIWQKEAEGQPNGSKAYAVTRLLKGLAVSYDCLAGLWSDEESAEIRDAIARIGRKYYDGYFSTASIAGPGFHTHHAIVEWASFGVAALALLGEYGPAETWLAATVDKFEKHLLPTGLAADGAQTEGSTFWASTMQYRLFFMDALRRVTGRDLFTPFQQQMSADLALASIAAPKREELDQEHETVILEPSYGQLNYYAPVLLALAREYRNPLHQHLALWDETLGSLQKTRYVTPNGERLLFELGGLAYAWYDDSVPAEVGADAPLSFAFPSVNEAYARGSYGQHGIVAGVRHGRAVVHAGGRPVLIELYARNGPPPATPELAVEDAGATATIRCTGAEGSGFATSSLELRRPDAIALHRTGCADMVVWCHGNPTRQGDTLAWPDGASLRVVTGSIDSMDPTGHRDEKIVGMGKLKCVDPSPQHYPLIRVLADAAAEMRVEITTPGSR